MKKNLIILFFGLSGTGFGQTNTAITSGSIGKCKVWDYPYTLYNNATASQTVNNGVTVTVDQDRSIGAVNFNGTGGMEMSGANGITLSGSGGEINCRWDIPAYGDHTIVNNTGVATNDPLLLATAFTAPYAGKFVWRNNGSTWNAGMSGAYLNGNIALSNSSGAGFSIFSQDEPGTCGTAPGGTGTKPVKWTGAILVNLVVGGTLSYRAGTGYSTDPGCADTEMTCTIGTAFVTYEN